VSSDAFPAAIASLRDDIDAALAASFMLEPDPDLKRYLYRPAADFTAAGGKRTRPALVCLGAMVSGTPARAALSAAAAVEHFQSAALVHDDIADESLTRRGVPCVHVTQGVGPAINVGDCALVESFACIIQDASLSADKRIALLGELQEMMARTIEGQALDLGWARDGRWDIAPGDYLKMATLKTAHYSAATPLVLGAIVAGADEAHVEALRRMGLSGGLAFQLQDDLLNLVGDAEAQGKDFRSDITEGKRTLLVVEALSRLDASKRDELIGLLESHTANPDDLAYAVRLIESSGAVDAVRTLAETLAGEADEALASVDWPDALDGSLEALEAMPGYFIDRRA
jgi:geranylgeranyl diphosphate synthase type I